MVEKRFLKLSLLLVAAFTGASLLGAVVYIVLQGAPGTKGFLAIGILGAVVLSGFSALASVVLTTIDVVQAKKMTFMRKFIWVAGMWLVLGVIASAAYYFLEKKD